MELVAGPHRPGPFQLVETGPDDAARWLELAVIEEAHGEGGGVPAARGEAAQDGMRRSFLVEMERLGIKFGGEGFYPCGIDPQAAGAESLAWGQILEIALGHRRVLQDRAPPATGAALMRPTAASAALNETTTSIMVPLRTGAKDMTTSIDALDISAYTPNIGAYALGSSGEDKLPAHDQMRLDIRVYTPTYMRICALVEKESEMPVEPKLQTQDCNCFAVRQAARHVTQFYDQYLAQVGLRTSQFAILAKLRRLGPMTINTLAAELVMDRTTMGRNILPLARDGFIAIKPGASDRRVKELHLTATGTEKVKSGLKLWAAAQTRFEAAFGPKRSSELRDLLLNLVATDLGSAPTRTQQRAG
jgi:DNA-binding MarR family transcriptional regulator